MQPRTFILETVDQQCRFAAFIAKQNLPLEVSVCAYKKRRTIPQNKRLWDLHGLASEATGYSKDEMHDLALCKHFGSTETKRTNPLTGREEVRQVPLKRSSDLNTAAFAKFMDATEIWYANELGIFLP
tara:strand:- start:331 stop:714 length:384 start_codon:yes stop_codon:yes gene_type:complete